jgi:serine/threonine-protein kinase
MGVVYLARDPRLDRQVAIKVLPDRLTPDPDSLARFDREAKLLASLNHPNIAAIYGIETDEASRQQFLVLEYVPGDTLAARIAGGALPIDEALDVCRQIVLAIEAAHEGGVIHRDLKPGNVKVTPDGQVKVLDFGLAKLTRSEVLTAASDPTISLGLTKSGTILGTAGYMSPEQARGKDVDKRTDIWSFGCVLFECLTGRRPFEGETISDTIAKILERDPDWTAVPASTPPRIRELLRQCLERDAKKRRRDIGDVRIELDEALAERASSSRLIAGTVHEKAPPARSAWILAIAAFLLVVGAAAGIGLWRGFGPAARGGTGASGGPVRLSVVIPPSIHATSAGFTRDGRRLIVLGFPRRPDGTDRASSGYGQIYTRGIGDYEFLPIPGTEGAAGYWLSPDGVWLAFVAVGPGGVLQRRLSKVRVDGSAPPVALADWDPGWESMTWLEDGDLLISSDNSTEFFRLPSGGGPAKPAIQIDMGGITDASIESFGKRLPHDRGVFLTIGMRGARGRQQDQWLLDPKTGKAHLLIENAGNAAWAPTGHIVFTRGEVLMAVPFDLDRLVVTGEVTALENGVRMPDTYEHGEFEITDDGSLIYPPGGRLGTDRQIVTVDAAGTVTPFMDDLRPYQEVRATRDARRVAATLPDSKGKLEIWVADLDRPGLRRVVTLPNADCDLPVWAPDGRRLAFQRTARDKDDGIYIQAADGSGSPQVVLKQDSPEELIWPTSWAPDGSGLFATKSVGGAWDLLFVPLSAAGNPGPPRNARDTSASDWNAQVSPDGRLIAFISADAGQPQTEVYVSMLGTDGVLGPPVMVSRKGGAAPAAWAGDSRRLFYWRGDKLMLATVETKPGLSASTPVVVQNFKKLGVVALEWDILPDGRLIGIQKGQGEDDITKFHVVLNWFDELKAKMGKGK